MSHYVRLEERPDSNSLSGNEIFEIIQDGIRKKSTLHQAVSTEHSTEEQSTNVSWIDGKKIYRKIVLLPQMPTTRQEIHVPHGIDSLSKIIKFEAYLTDNITTLQSTHTAIGNNEEDYAIASWMNTTHVVISPGRDQSHLTSGHAIIEYTK